MESHSYKAIQNLFALDSEMEDLKNEDSDNDQAQIYKIADTINKQSTSINCSNKEREFEDWIAIQDVEQILIEKNSVRLVQILEMNTR